MEIEGPQIDRLLDTWPVARLATLGPSGAPHQVPIVFARCDGFLWSPIDGKRKRSRGLAELARVGNLRRDARCSLLLDHYGADWSRLWWLRVEGNGEAVSASDPSADPILRAAVVALEAKYPQYERTPLFSGEPTLLRIRIGEIRSWCADPAGRLGA